MQITGPWLTAPETQVVCAMLAEAGYKALFVGGCVRNTLLQVPVKDIDIATDARPERVLELARKAGLNAIPTGIDHGTVTVVSGHIPHEITTFECAGQPLISICQQTGSSPSSESSNDWDEESCESLMPELPLEPIQ